jgi:EutQ-like cupin domain
MKIIRQAQSIEVKNDDNCIVYEYPLGDRDINGAFAKLTWREPTKGRLVNTVCKELAYVIRGNGVVVIEDREIQLSVGDLVLIEPGEKYFWEGNMDLFIPCSPAWYPEQHKLID